MALFNTRKTSIRGVRFVAADSPTAETRYRAGRGVDSGRHRSLRAGARGSPPDLGRVRQRPTHPGQRRHQRRVIHYSLALVDTDSDAGSDTRIDTKSASTSGVGGRRYGPVWH